MTGQDLDIMSLNMWTTLEVWRLLIQVGHAIHSTVFKMGCLVRSGAGFTCSPGLPPQTPRDQRRRRRPLESSGRCRNSRGL